MSGDEQAFVPRRNDVPPTPAQREELHRTWSDPPGFVGWLSAIDHKTIGLRGIKTAFAFFLAAGTLPNEAAQLKRWIRDPQSIKPGAQMPRSELSDADLDALVHWLGTLK